MSSISAKRLLRYRPGSPTDRHFGLTFGSSRQASGSAARICALRPHELLLLGTDVEVEALSRELPADESRATIDVSHGFLGLEIEGPAARSVLAKVCNLDLSDPMLPPGACAPAQVAEVGCDIIRLDSGDGEPPRLMVLAPRSYGHYLQESLVDAGREFQMSGP